MRKDAPIAVLLLAVLAVSGCAESPSEVGPVGGTSDWEQFHAEFPDVPKPETTVVRTVDPAEWASVIANCMHEAGFPDVVAEEDGSLSWEGLTEQAEQLGLAKYICLAQYPLDPKYTTKPTEEQIGKVYDYLTLVQVPCLEELGFEIPEPPSKTRFIETYLDSPEWLPYAQVAGPDVPAEAYEQAVELCPQSPPPGSEYDLF